jgi:hypothetical protein
MTIASDTESDDGFCASGRMQSIAALTSSLPAAGRDPPPLRPSPETPRALELEAESTRGDFHASVKAEKETPSQTVIPVKKKR